MLRNLIANMENIDFQRLTRIVQNLWQSEPRNDDPSAPIWCLGRRYLSPPSNSVHVDGQTYDGSDASRPQREQHDTVGQGQGQSHGDDDDDGNGGGIISGNSDGNDNDNGNGNGDSNDSTSNNNNNDDGHTVTDNVNITREWPVDFLDDFESRIWITYRSNFPPIAKSNDPEAIATMTITVRLRSQLVNPNGFTSDTGWGCMVRSGQSLLANTLSILTLGRDWRRGDNVEEESKIILLFADNPLAPFSIHRFVEAGSTHCGKYPGQWFGPSATARCIQELVKEAKDVSLNVYTSLDSPDVYEDKLHTIASQGPKDFNPTLILLGVRLGLERINPVYWEALGSMLQMSQAVGIAGGRPSSSLYFIGVQGPYFFYLDPHTTRAAPQYNPESSSLKQAELDTYHTRRLRRLHVQDMDPSMLLGFLVKDEDDFRRWKDEISSAKYRTIIHVSENQPSQANVQYVMREAAVDEVEALDDDDEFDT